MNGGTQDDSDSMVSFCTVPKSGLDSFLPQPLALQSRKVRGRHDVQTKFYMWYSSKSLDAPTRIDDEAHHELGTLYFHGLEDKFQGGAAKWELWMWRNQGHEEQGVGEWKKCRNLLDVTHPLHNDLYLHISPSGLPGWVLKETMKRKHKHMYIKPRRKM